jgi:hypothetical protein
VGCSPSPPCASKARPGGSTVLHDARSKDVHNLIDELLEQEATPVPECVMNDFLTVLALHLLDLSLAFFGRLLRMGLGVDLVTFVNLLKCLYDARRTYEATNGLLHRMLDFACVPNTAMCSILLKCFYGGRRSGWALEPLRLMAKEEHIPHRCC